MEKRASHASTAGNWSKGWKGDRRTEAYEGLAEVLLERAALGGARLRGGELGSLALLVGDAGGLGAGVGLPLPLGLHQLHLVGVLPPQLAHVARVPLAQPVQPRPRFPGLRGGLPAAQVLAGLGELVRLRPRQGPRGGVEATEEGAQEVVRTGGGERHRRRRTENKIAVAAEGEAAGAEQRREQNPPLAGPRLFPKYSPAHV